VLEKDREITGREIARFFYFKKEVLL